MPHHICLIVDDEPAIRSYLSGLLEREKLQCLEARNATEALRAIKHVDGNLDLVVTDIKMGGDMNGIDLAHWIRSVYPKIAVLLITGYADEEKVRRAASVFRLIQKPFAVGSILHAVRQTINACQDAEGGEK
jgi:two-component system NtrC family sensor kinase